MLMSFLLSMLMMMLMQTRRRRLSSLLDEKEVKEREVSAQKMEMLQ